MPIVLAVILFFFIAVLGVLRVCGLIRPFYVPTGAMTPTVAAGDYVMMEGVTFLERKPRRGDVVVFRTDGIDLLPSKTIFVMRIAGEPEEHVRISDGRLYINDARVVISNDVGEIVYSLPPRSQSFGSNTDLTVPKGQYYVLGDNSTNSFDSRFWGCLPAGNVMGRIWFCYWPPARIGPIR
jgi:signal peptidase I